MVSCVVRHGEKEFPVSALLDSGADYSLFNPSVAAWLGIKVSHGQECEVNVASGAVEKGFFHEVLIELLGAPVKCKVIFLSREIADFDPLLGREGLFDHYRITFENEARYLRRCKLGRWCYLLLQVRLFA